MHPLSQPQQPPGQGIRVAGAPSGRAGVGQDEADGVQEAHPDARTDGAGEIPKANQQIEVPGTARFFTGTLGQPQRTRFVGRVERGDGGVHWAVDLIQNTRVPLSRAYRTASILPSMPR